MKINQMIANPVPSASFRDKQKAIFFQNCYWDNVAQLQGKYLYSKDISQTFRNNHQLVLENFANFTAKRLRWSLTLIKPEGLQIYLKQIQTHVFSCEICDIFKSAYFEEYLQRLLLNFKDKFYVNIIFKTSTV